MKNPETHNAGGNEIRTWHVLTLREGTFWARDLEKTVGRVFVEKDWDLEILERVDSTAVDVLGRYDVIVRLRGEWSDIWQYREALLKGVAYPDMLDFQAFRQLYQTEEPPNIKSPRDLAVVTFVRVPGLNIESVAHQAAGTGSYIGEVMDGLVKQLGDPWGMLDAAIRNIVDDSGGDIKCSAYAGIGEGELGCALLEAEYRSLESLYFMLEEIHEQLDKATEESGEVVQTSSCPVW